MEGAGPASLASFDTVRVTNPGGSSPFVLTCDHASDFIPAEFGTLGLAAEDLSRHIAWDPGALPVATRMARAIRRDPGGNPHFASRHRLQPAARCPGPGAAGQRNDNHTGQYRPVGKRARRTGRFIMAAVSRCHRANCRRQAGSGARDATGVGPFLTPVFKEKNRPWHIGIIHDEDQRLASPLISALKRHDGVTVGVNEPYSPADRVYFTLERHARSRGLPCAMIEIRNDEIAGETGQRKWEDLLTGIFSSLEPEEAKGSRRSAIGKSVQSAS